MTLLTMAVFLKYGFNKPILAKRCLDMMGVLKHAQMFFSSGKCGAASYDKHQDLLSKYKGGSVDLLKDESSGIAVITLNNPKKKNALTGSMMVELEDKINILEKWDRGCGLILKGQDGTFCSGADLSLIQALLAGKQEGYPDLMSSYMQAVTTQLLNLPLISVALIEGAALGGGTELITACDFRIMKHDASVGFVQVRMGLSPGWGGGVRLVNLLGRSAALRIFSSAAVMKSQEAKGVGLVDVVCPESQNPADVALDFLKNLTKSSPDVTRAMKNVIVNASDVLDKFDGERNIFNSLFGGQANLDALNKKAKF